ncbi:hypothetical protein WBG78_15765 [Chryseolinea sp. T2]|uniref:hypothetical protein n=1 Tax=Chryseolinea sp. T2 TaxID=3129255 RepID=UPI0030770045
MKLIIGFVLLVVVMKMRSWGRRNYYRDEMLKPAYQCWPLFWLLFSLSGIAAFATAMILIITSIYRML